MATFDDGIESTEAILQLGSRIDCFLGPRDATSWRETCNVVNLGFYSIETFNECDRRSILMETLDAWSNVHPGFASLRMDWGYRIPFGLIFSKAPSAEMELFAEELASLAKAGE